MQHQLPVLRRCGFTLLEMSIVLAIIAVVMGGGLAIFSAALDKRQFQETQMKLAAIQKAFLNYRITYNSLPCPADITQPYASQYFGLAVPYSGCFTSTAHYFGTTTGLRKALISPPPEVTYLSTTSAAVAGMVPTRTLQLPDDYAIDGWGRRIYYVVDYRFPQSNSFTTIPITNATARLTINAATAGPTKTTLAVYVLISFGPNGHGAWPRNSSGTIARISAKSVNTDELTNCHCQSTAVESNFTKVFVQKMATLDPSNILDSFDDIVVYATRARSAQSQRIVGPDGCLASDLR